MSQLHFIPMGWEAYTAAGTYRVYEYRSVRSAFSTATFYPITGGAPVELGNADTRAEVLALCEEHARDCAGPGDVTQILKAV